MARDAETSIHWPAGPPKGVVHAVAGSPSTAEWARASIDPGIESEATAVTPPVAAPGMPIVASSVSSGASGFEAGLGGQGE